MADIDELILINPRTAETKTVTEYVSAYYQQGVPTVRFPKTEEPTWARKGTEVVAAYDDGSVECSFTVHFRAAQAILDEVSQDFTGTYRIYREDFV